MEGFRLSFFRILGWNGLMRMLVFVVRDLMSLMLRGNLRFMVMDFLWWVRRLGVGNGEGEEEGLLMWRIEVFELERSRLVKGFEMGVSLFVVENWGGGGWVWENIFGVRLVNLSILMFWRGGGFIILKL